MPAFFLTVPVRIVSICLGLMLSGTVFGAHASSAGYRKPVELSIRGEDPCWSVRLGSPDESALGWSIQLRQGTDGAVIWKQKVSGEPIPKPPMEALTCLIVNHSLLRAGQPYRLEFSTYQVYRSDFCWQGASPLNPVPRLLHVREDTGQCSDLPWVGGDGDALTTRGNWNRLILWWRGLFGH
jgi:hypothetical protein